MKINQIGFVIGATVMLVILLRGHFSSSDHRIRHDLFIIALLLFSLVAMALKWFFTSSPDDSHSDAQKLSDKEVIAEFQRRRVGFLRFGLLPMGAGMLVIFLAVAYIPFTSFMGFPGKAVGFVAGLVCFAAGSVYTGDQYKCPACNKVPISSMSGGSSGVVLNPDACPNCGAKLR